MPSDERDRQFELALQRHMRGTTPDAACPDAETLAEIGRKIGEHESSVSRNLERIRRELRAAVEDHLQGKQALSEAETALCLEYAAEDSPIDFRKMFPEKDTGKAGEGRKGTP